MGPLDFAINANPTRLCKHEIRDRETHELIGEILHQEDAKDLTDAWNEHKKLRDMVDELAIDAARYRFRRIAGPKSGKDYDDETDAAIEAELQSPRDSTLPPRETAMSCPTCCARKGEPHKRGCKAGPGIA